MISSTAIAPEKLKSLLVDTQSGGFVSFEGWVRNHNLGQAVTALDYQVYDALAYKEGSKIIGEALAKFNLCHAIACHRSGHLELGEIAVWVGTTAHHRRGAFLGTEYIIDQIKVRLPIWKKEHYVDQPSAWVYCREHHSHLSNH
ncbi:molybdopterin synthase catalytic subunit [Candidatus Synechococcus calcipolaris]|uniref:molybdopterin synthase catalytic subunit n=1 Tax=Candidatus Synechococcus calcipolaris TaxID=1522304 RepID=UPI00241193B5|nr:molybdenum cofactor biosynthesis protein MoaE [Candidatus Synechococcus calcipolaris]